MRDTKGAEGDLHMAMTYLKERDNTISTDVPRRTNLLEKATEYIALAKRKDPDVEIEIDGRAVTVDSAAAAVHMEHFIDFRHTASYSVEERKKKALLQAKEHAEIAFSLGKDIGIYGDWYCDILLDLHDKAGAVAFAEKMCEANPDLSTKWGRDCRLNLDRVLAAPQTRDVTAFEKFWDLNGGIIIFVGGIASIIGSIVLAANFGAEFLLLTVFLIGGLALFAKLHGDAYISERIGNQLKEDVTRYQRTGKW